MSFHPARFATEKQSHRLPAVRDFAVHEEAVMDGIKGFVEYPKPAMVVDLGRAEGVTMITSDRGLELIFRFDENGTQACHKVAVDYLLLADVDERLGHFLREAALMYTMGMNPYNSQHRSSFLLAQLQGSSDA